MLLGEGPQLLALSPPARELHAASQNVLSWIIIYAGAQVCLSVKNAFCASSPFTYFSAPFSNTTLAITTFCAVGEEKGGVLWKVTLQGDLMFSY